MAKFPSQPSHSKTGEIVNLSRVKPVHDFAMVTFELKDGSTKNVKLPASNLVKRQFIKKVKNGVTLPDYNSPVDIIVWLRFDDECGNGHNTFSITADIYEAGRRGDKNIIACGCVHNEIAYAFPALAPFTKWHLCSTDGPLYYLQNTLFHVENGELDNARNTAIWPDAPSLESFTEETLLERLPALMEEFKAAMESLGFEY